MATFYLARDIKHERDVAVKVLKLELAASIGSARFLEEIRVTANLRQPHIGPLDDSGDANGALYYVMPLLQGESLADRLKRESMLPVDATLRITKQIVSALDVAHRHGVVHRARSRNRHMMSTTVFSFPSGWTDGQGWKYRNHRSQLHH